MIQLLARPPPPPLPAASSLSFSASLCVAVGHTDGRAGEGVDVESNHENARKPGHLYIIQYPLVYVMYAFI
jgi:hypothetical protein